MIEILVENYGIDRIEAETCAFNYLKAFRKCPENVTISLDQWRFELWSNALSEQYRHLAYAIYEQWKMWRYHFLQLPSDLVQMLKQLRKNYLLAILTNGTSNAQWEKIHELHLNKAKNSLFDCILVSGDLSWEKPDSKIFLAACNYLNVSPQNVMMIGDKLETDIQVMSNFKFNDNFIQLFIALPQSYSFIHNLSFTIKTLIISLL